jgi:Rod binding domain-containing protein
VIHPSTSIGSGLGDPRLTAAVFAAGENPAQPLAARAREVAVQFEAIFVQQMVGALRSSADGFGGGMFGGDPGADTYAAWFDRCMSEHIGRGSGIGLARIIEQDIVRHDRAGAPPAAAQETSHG